MKFRWPLLALAVTLAGAAFLFTLVIKGDEQMHKVIRVSIREDGLVATYFRPKGDVMRPAIMVLGGSEGGIKSAEMLAYKFAERGWAALAVAYFGMPGLPERLGNIPLEHFDPAVAWLQRQPLIESNELAVVGTSRGGELALLLASYQPAFKRVIAYVPSSVVWGPVGVFTNKSVSAWTLGGTPLPYVSHVQEPDYSAKPYRGTPDFLADLQQTGLVEAAAIPVEKIHGAILLLSGEDDQVWPSALMSHQIMKRLADTNHPYRFEHVSFPDAGHLIGPGADPGLRQAKHPTGVIIAFGGNKKGNQNAQKQSWGKVLEFLAADPRLPVSAPGKPITH